MESEGEILESIVSVILGGGIDRDSVVAPETLKRVLQLANYHGVEALVIDSLEADARWQELASELRDQLKSRLKMAAALQLARSQDLIAAAKAFEKEGIPFLVLKGSGLASSHYSLPYLRDRCDTDIFIDLNHIGLVRDIFLKLGYQGSGFVYKSHQFDFSSVRFGGMCIYYDVHWRISNSARFSRVLPFQEAREGAVTIEGMLGVLGIKPVHALLLACIHRAANPDHDPNRLIWIYDIHLLSIGLSDGEWSEFCDIAGSRSVNEVCQQALQKSAETFKTDLPLTVMRRLSVPSPPDSLATRFRMTQLGLILDDMRELPDLSSRLEMVGEYLFPSGQYLLDRYEKSGRIWVPVLYCRYLVGGLVARLSFR